MDERPLTIEDIIIPVQSLHGHADFPAIFGNHNPVELEIGAGKGTFLINAAKAQPATNFLGIEWANKYYKYAADRARRWGLSNIRLLRCDAREFLTHHNAPETIRAFHIYFPDPWPKKRHHKRRLFSQEFLTSALSALQPDGQLHVATDYREYFEIIKPLLTGCDKLEVSDFTPRHTAELGEWVGTNFERKYLAEGRTIYGCSARKITPQPA